MAYRYRIIVRIKDSGISRQYDGEFSDQEHAALTRNVFRNGSPPFVQTGTVFDMRWTDSTSVKVDTARRLH